jgi:hypothetical protein
MDWLGLLNGDPLPWLLDEETPEVRHLALRQLLHRSERDPNVVAAQAAAMAAAPIATILESQHPDGYWVKSGPGYSPKYRGTVWQLIFLEQLGANGSDERIRAACAYVLAHTQAPSGGFGASGSERTPPPPSSVLHCLNGNLLRSLIAFGWLDDPRVRQAIDWQARSITGEGFDGYYRSRTSGSGFCCGVNEGLPCGWGAIKALRGLASILREQREPHVQRAIEQGGNFISSWRTTSPPPTIRPVGEIQNRALHGSSSVFHPVTPRISFRTLTFCASSASLTTPDCSRRYRGCSANRTAMAGGRTKTPLAARCGSISSAAAAPANGSLLPLARS